MGVVTGASAKAADELATFQFVPMPDVLWITVGDNLAALRFYGVTVPFADAVIATLGIENGIEIRARRPALSGNAKDPPSAQALPGTAVSNAEEPPGRPISPNHSPHGTRRLSFVSSSFCNGAPTALPPLNPASSRSWGRDCGAESGAGVAGKWWGSVQ